MTSTATERYRIALLGWLATVATSLSFFPALDQKSYLVQGALVSGLVVAVGIALRSFRTPPLAVFLLQLLLLVEVLLLWFGDQFKAGVLPTRATFAGIEQVLISGSEVAQAYAAPAPANAGLLLMVVFGIALVALIVDGLATGFGRVPLAGLPLLALYTVPVAALPTGVPFYAFVPGAAAYIAMLMADERDRVSHWGRLVRRHADTPQAGRLDTAGLDATGRKVTLLALSIAVVLPIFVPALSSSILDSGRATQPGTGTGGGTLSFGDPMVSLANSLKRDEAVDLLEVSSTINPSYLRLVVLDTPGANAWTAQSINLDETLSLESTLPRPIGLGADVVTRASSMSIGLTDAFPDDSAWLPVPYNAQSIATSADFAYVPDDQTVAARRGSALDGLTSYEVFYSTVEPTSAQLKAAGPAPTNIVDRFGEVPPQVPAVVGTTARAVTAGAQTRYDQALLLQSFFRAPGEFTYDLEAGYGYGFDAMADFLAERRGFCQHYSATMAMMARSLGIPSRVVVGFLQPDHINIDGEYVLTSHNVHAWPELFFEGVGWVRFEPTPGLSAPLPEYAQLTASPTANTTAPTDPVPTGPSASVEEPRNTALRDGPAAGESGSSGSGGPLPSRGWLLALGAIALALLPAALRYAVRRARMTRPLDSGAAAESAWMEVRDHVRDLRLPWVGSMTPRAREQAVTPMLHGDADGLAALHRLAMGVERARYSTSLAPDATPVDDARTVISVISRESDRGRRVRAFLLPSSLLPDMQRGWARLLARLMRREDEDSSSTSSLA